jgi:hypothetical protein
MKTILIYGSEVVYTDKTGVFNCKFGSDDLRFIVSNDLIPDIDAIIVYVDVTSNVLSILEDMLKNIRSSNLNVPYIICVKNTFGKCHYHQPQ